MKSKRSCFRFIYDNDFFSATDRYYSQGVILELIFPSAKKGLLPKLLMPLAMGSKRRFGWGVEQDCFTPKSIRYDTLNRLERPYCGLLYLRRFLNSWDEVAKRKLSAEIQIGIIGPNAKLEETQKGIHRALVNIQPLGWEYQVSQDILLNYVLGFEKALVTTRYFELNGCLDGRAGTIYDDVAGGLHLRAGIMDPYFRDLTAEPVSPRKFQVYFTARGSAKQVFYNGTMQGGPFSKSIHTISAENITRQVYFASFSVVVVLKQLHLEYLKAYTTKEFVWGIDHGWGRCNIGYFF